MEYITLLHEVKLSVLDNHEVAQKAGKGNAMGFHDEAQVILRELDTVLSQVDEAEIAQAIDLIEHSDKVFFNALGRAGFMGKSFLMRLMHMGREVYVVGETNTPNFGENDLLIICSGSGSTKQFVDIANKAKSLGGKVLVFTGTPGSPLTQIADGSIVLKAPSKKQDESSFVSEQPMASLFEQAILLTGDAMVLQMMHASSEDNEEMFSRHSNLE